MPFTINNLEVYCDMIFNLAGLQARQTGSSIKTKVLLRVMLIDTTAHQDVLIKQALSLLRVQLQTALRKPLFQRLMQLERLCLAPTMADGIIGVAFERDVRELPFHPAIERIVKKKIRQHGADN